MLPQGFGRRIALVMAGALAIRLAYTGLVADDITVRGDALTFHKWAASIASGDGFRASHETDPTLAAQPTAEHPPLFPLLLAGLVKLGLGGTLAQKLALCVPGTLTVGLIGLAGREAAGATVGVVAAGLAAVYPFLWLADGSLMSETLYGTIVAGVLYLALRFARTPSLRLALGLGAAVGLAALTRGEALLLLVVLVLPLALRAGGPPRRRAALAATAVGAAVLVLLPWTVRNLATFDKPVLISTNATGTLAGANCARTYYGDFIGGWVLACYGSRPPGDASEQALVYRDRGLRYARDHLGRVPLVMAARIARVWDLYRPLQQADYEILEGRSRTGSRIGLAMYYPLLLLALAGAALMRRRRGPLLPLLALPALVSITGLLFYGISRFRFAAEPALLVLAAMALFELVPRALDRVGARPARPVASA